MCIINICCNLSQQSWNNSLIPICFWSNPSNWNLKYSDPVARFTGHRERSRPVAERRASLSLHRPCKYTFQQKPVYSSFKIHSLEGSNYFYRVVWFFSKTKSFRNDLTSGTKNPWLLHYKIKHWSKSYMRYKYIIKKIKHYFVQNTVQ